MKPQYISMCRKATEIQERGFPRGAQVVVKPYGYSMVPRQTTGRIVGRHPDYKKKRAGGKGGEFADWYMLVVEGKIQALPKSNLIWILDEGDLLKLYGRHWIEFGAACAGTFRVLPVVRGGVCEKVEIGLRVVMASVYGKEWDGGTKEWVSMK